MSFLSAKWRLFVALATLAASMAFVSSPAGAVEYDAESGTAFDLGRTDQIIVTYDNWRRLSAAEIERLAGPGARKLRTLDATSDVIKLASQAEPTRLSAMMTEFRSHDLVAAVEPDLFMVPMRVPNDPDFSRQWDLTNPSSSGVYGINAPAAWDITTGSSNVTVAVLDTGYLDHPDLNFVPGYDFVSDSRIGNDGNGRDSDARDPGDWITAAEARSGFFAGCGVGDSSWHGSHVAGTIGARTNNGRGIAGINWNSKVLPVRVLGKCGGYTSDITDGVRWAAGLSVSGVPSNPNPAKVINLSLGGGGSCPSVWQNAINAVTARGTVVVVAAGNSNQNAANFSPAGCNGVISVASTGKAGNRAYYSNYGSTVEIAAPGGDTRADNGDTILSTVNNGTRGPATNNYERYQGTSMAAPHVAGIASLMLSVDSSLTPSEVNDILRSTSRSFPSNSCRGSTPCGAGIVDAAAAVAAADGGGTPPPPPPPPPPSGFGKSSPGDGVRTGRTVTFSWDAVSGASGYRVCLDTSDNNTCNGRWYNFSGTSARGRLGANTTYYWQVQAVTGNGNVNADGGDWWAFRTN